MKDLEGMDCDCGFGEGCLSFVVSWSFLILVVEKVGAYFGVWVMDL